MTDISSTQAVARTTPQIRELTWQDAIERIAPHVVKISTPLGWGTGFLIWNSQVNENICAVATAAHVVQHANYWEEPIRITHMHSGQTILLREGERAIFPDESKDTAAILFNKEDVPLPPEALPMTPPATYAKVGVEVGWLGFPHIAPDNLCFFSGRTSSWQQDQTRYLIDGVAINGVSGGPTFFIAGSAMMLIGAVSAYIANRATGETLPGLCVVTDVSHFLNEISRYNSIDQAKEEEPPTIEPPPAPPQIASPNPIETPSKGRLP